MSNYGFTARAKLEVGDELEFVVLAPLSYVSKSGEVITVPAGFETDLATIPAIFTPFLNVNGKHREPAILHDYLYTIQDRNRKQCDQLFLESMESKGVSKIERGTMYSGVRIGGWLRWSRSAKSPIPTSDNTSSTSPTP